MKGLIALSVALLASASVQAADRGRVQCDDFVSATGVSSHVEGGRGFERYKDQVPPGLARSRAIENWQIQISNACPAHSMRWWRARAARVDCEGTPGHESCTATARPARKLLSYLMPY